MLPRNRDDVEAILGLIGAPLFSVKYIREKVLHPSCYRYFSINTRLLYPTILFLFCGMFEVDPRM